MAAMSTVGVNDMIVMDELSEATILENLKKRYAKDIIYTYTGFILVSVNPFKQLKIYEQESVQQYINQPLSASPPHIFGIAELAFQTIKRNGDNQSIIVSGESGAGKTETTKYVLQYLTSVASHTTKQDTWIEQKILEANKVLESFGNSKTVRNHNSSRFGKFIHIHFDDGCRIVGASIQNYLLEKSRVIRPNTNERGYHAFYEMIRGASDDEVSTYLLKTPEHYEYLKMSKLFDIEEIDDSMNFQRLKVALQVLSFTSDELDYILRTLSIILWLGNITFTEIRDGAIKLDQNEALDSVVALSKIDKKSWEFFLTEKVIKAGSDITRIPYKIIQALDNRDSTSKSLYTIMFDFITGKINQKLNQDTPYKHSIGILDIFGFECFEKNSFEQLCINYTNEKLQQHFNEVIFKLEKKEYAAEGISMDTIDFHDNQPCLDLIESKPLGLLYLLDEESRFPKGTDESWLAKIQGKWCKHAHFATHALNKSVFSIKHYAGDVNYQIVSFLDKNRDLPSENIVNFLSKSESPVLASLMKANVQQASPANKQTIGVQFRNQLNSLMDSIAKTSIHYVRCLKPNHDRAPDTFVDSMVLSQLTYTGMLETIKIRKAGYSKRSTLDKFVEMYFCLHTASNFWSMSNAQKASDILLSTECNPKTFFVGKVKVFLKEATSEKLDKLKETKEYAAAVRIQKSFRGFKTRQFFLKMMEAIPIIQKTTRGYLARKQFKTARNAAIIIQAYVRGWFARDMRRQLEEEAAQKQKSQQLFIAASVGPSPAISFGAITTLPEVDENCDPNYSATSSPSTESPLDGLPLPIKSEKLSSQANSPSKLSPRGSIASKKDRRPSIFALHVDTGLNTIYKDAQDATNAKKMNNNPLRRQSIKEQSAPATAIESYSVEQLALLWLDLDDCETGEAKSQKVHTLMRLQNLPLTKPLTKIIDPTSAQSAVDGYALLLRAVKSNTLKTVYQDIKLFIALGIEKPALRDELFLQVVSVMYPPEARPEYWATIEENAWYMFALMCCSFHPSRELAKHLVKFLHGWRLGINETQQRLIKFMLYATEGMKRVSVYGHRKHVPSRYEMESVKFYQMSFDFWFLDDTKESIVVHSTTTVADIVKEMAKKVKLSDAAVWGLYQTNGELESWLKPTDYICDVFYAWEYLYDQRSGMVNDGGAGRTGASEDALHDWKEDLETARLVLEEDFKFCLRRRLFKNLSLDKMTAIEVRLCYAQTVIDVMRDHYRIPDEYLIRMSAINLRILCPPSVDHVEFLASKMFTFVPPRMLNNAAYWQDRISKEYKDYWQSASISVAIQEYMTLAMSLRRWGWHFFPAYYRGNASEANRMLVGVSSDCIEFISPLTREPLMFFPMKSVKGYDFMLPIISLVIKPQKTIGTALDASRRMSIIEYEDGIDGDSDEVYQFTCDSPDDFIALMKDYNPLAFGPDAKSPVHQVQVVDAETLRQDVNKAKQELIVHNVVFIPGESPAAAKGSLPPPLQIKASEENLSGKKKKKEGKRSTILGTLLRSSSSLASKSSGSINNINAQKPKGLSRLSTLFSKEKRSSGLSKADVCITNKFEDLDNSFKFTKTPLLHPITAAALRECEEWAMNLHEHLMSMIDEFVNQVKSPVGQDHAMNNANLAGDKLKKMANHITAAFGTQAMVDELYLQLVRLPVDYPAAAYFNQMKRIWQFFLICTCVFAPSELVATYVKAQLRKIYCAPPTRYNQYDISYAKACRRNMQKIASVTRKTRPSLMEMSLMVRSAPLSVTVVFSDGRTRPVTFEFSTTVKEMMAKVGQLLDVQDLKEYGLYRIGNGYETRMKEEEWMVDHYGLVADDPEFANKPFFRFKRRVLTTTLTSNAVEYRLMAEQSLRDLKAGYLVMPLEKICHVVALAMQLHHGDAGQGKVNYVQVINDYIPERYANDGQLVERLAKAYNRLKGMRPEIALNQLMTEMEQCPEFGGCGFKVTQSFKKNMPKHCLVVINHTGFHVVGDGASHMHIEHSRITGVFPTKESLLLQTGSYAHGDKFMFSTMHEQAFEMADLLNEHKSRKRVSQ